MDYKDYYKVMGVEKTASPDEIRHAYRRLARKYHPDVSKEADAEAKFKEVGEAYEVLKDPEKRKKYDQFGQYWQQQNNPGSTRGAYTHEAPTGEEAAAFQDFLDSILRQRHQEAYRQRAGEDVHARLAISLEDSFEGRETLLQLQSARVDAHGELRLEPRTVKVKIPKGVMDGQVIRLRGQGESGHGGPAGDLYIEIHINPHPLYRLEKRDIYLTLPITPWEAALGATVSTPTPGGVVKLKIPPGTSSGKSLRLKGRGLPGHPPGDVRVLPEIVLPPNPSEPMKALYEQMARLNTFNPRESLGMKHEG